MWFSIVMGGTCLGMIAANDVSAWLRFIWAAALVYFVWDANYTRQELYS